MDGAHANAWFCFYRGHSRLLNAQGRPRADERAARLSKALRALGGRLFKRHLRRQHVGHRIGREPNIEAPYVDLCD